MLCCGFARTVFQKICHALAHTHTQTHNSHSAGVNETNQNAFDDIFFCFLNEFFFVVVVVVSVWINNNKRKAIPFDLLGTPLSPPSEMNSHWILLCCDMFRLNSSYCLHMIQILLITSSRISLVRMLMLIAKAI